MIDKGVHIVLKQIGFILAVMVSAALLGLPTFALARGGGGGGSGHGGGGGGRGFHGGPGSGRGISPGYHGYTGGYHGYNRGSVGYRGYPGYRGWGYPGYYYGWGYPYYGYGLGLGLGLGLGYGLSSGYGYSSYYGSGYPMYASSANTSTVPSSVLTASATTTSDPAAAKSQEFSDRGDTLFRTSNYEGATYAWRHAVVDDPQNPLLVLKLAQALFAMGKYEEAAGATQAAMRQLPKEQWSAIVSRYQELYGKPQDYTQQLKALEKAINKKPDDPALHFLAGYHYGYLSFYKQSIEQLEKAIQGEPRDEIAKQLREEMKRQLAAREIPPATLPPAPAPETYWTTPK